jgi:hypothetical protein
MGGGWSKQLTRYESTQLLIFGNSEWIKLPDVLYCCIYTPKLDSAQTRYWILASTTLCT